MTGCLYISPPLIDGDLSNPVPVLFADVLISREEEIPGGVVLLPAAAEPRDLNKPRNSRLGRKVRIIDATVIAYAGHGNTINCLHEDIQENLAGWIAAGRPSKEMAERADLYRRTYPEAQAFAIGTTHIEGVGFNDLLFRSQTRIGRLGLCVAIGSGAEELMRRAAQYEPGFAKMATTNVYEAIRGFAGALNGQRLAEEFLRSSESDRDWGTDATWGGYVEYVYFDYRTSTWRRGPRSLTLLYVFDELEPGVRTLRLIPRAVAYDPGDASGHILAMTETALHYFSLPEDGAYARETLEFWSGWKPETVTATVLVPKDERVNFAQKTLDHRDMSAVHFAVHGDDAGAGLSRDFTDKLGAEIASAIGETYKPTWSAAPEQGLTRL